MVAGIFLASPTAPPEPPAPAVPARVGLRLSWTGWDDSSWALNSPSSLVRLTRGTRGLGMPEGQHVRSSSPGLHGSRWRGWRAGDRDVTWNLWVHSGGGEGDQLDLERAFWRTMDPNRPGRWVVTTPDGATRSLACRFVDDGQWVYQVDPLRFGWSRYTVTLSAEQPFWEGDPVVVPPLGNPLQRNFFGGGDPAMPGYGPPFFIGSGASAARARIDNPGDQPAWPEWVVVGPVTSAVVGIAGRHVQVPLQVQAGRALVIDSAPDAQWALEGDVVLDADGAPQLDEEGRVVVRNLAAPGFAGDRTRELGSRVEWAPIPPGTSVPLETSIVGTGAVQPSLTPLHARAW